MVLVLLMKLNVFFLILKIQMNYMYMKTLPFNTISLLHFMHISTYKMEKKFYLMKPNIKKDDIASNGLKPYLVWMVFSTQNIRMRYMTINLTCHGIQMISFSISYISFLVVNANVLY